MTTDKIAEAEIVHTRTAYAGWAKLVVATIRLPDGQTIERDIEDHGEAASILAYNPIRKTAVLVRQLRASVLYASKQQETLEVIAGIIEDTDALACVRREAMEEARLKLDSVEHIFTAWSMPGLSAERMHLHLGVYSGQVRPETKGGLAGEGESTIAVEIGLAELAQMADRNEIEDVKTLLLLQTLRLRKPELF
jgi:nudix-type nucleoside diphosphatase (YffH/AdpP family)